MNLKHFDDLLRMARAQPEPQRLLFVFAGAELPADASPEQRAAYEAGHGGELAPLMCADKTPDEITSFDALVQESEQFGLRWAIVFVGGLSGQGGRAPSDAQTDQTLQRMVDWIKAGQVDTLIPFNRRGEAVNLR